jgi:hypothetical protein
MDIVDEEMGDATSSSVSTPAPAKSTSTSAPSGPSRMSPQDLLPLTPDQIRSLTKSVAPKSISVDLMKHLSSSQQDALPSFVRITASDAPVMRRTRSKEKK